MASADKNPWCKIKLSFYATRVWSVCVYVCVCVCVCKCVSVWVCVSVRVFCVKNEKQLYHVTVESSTLLYPFSVASSNVSSCSFQLSLVLTLLTCIYQSSLAWLKQRHKFMEKSSYVLYEREVRKSLWHTSLSDDIKKHVWGRAKD